MDGEVEDEIVADSFLLELEEAIYENVTPDGRLVDVTYKGEKTEGFRRAKNLHTPKLLGTRENLMAKIMRNAK